MYMHCVKSQRKPMSTFIENFKKNLFIKTSDIIHYKWILSINEICKHIFSAKCPFENLSVETSYWDREYSDTMHGNHLYTVKILI